MRLPLIVSLFAASLLSPPLCADDEVNEAEAARLQSSGEVLPSDRVVEQARGRQSGKVTEVELKQKEGRYIYEVDIVDSGGVERELQFDARTGAFLSSEIEDEDGEDDNEDGGDEAAEREGDQDAGQRR
jgi:hypothetical protein